MLDDRSQAYRDMFLRLNKSTETQNGTTISTSGSYDSGSGLRQEGIHSVL